MALKEDDKQTPVPAIRLTTAISVPLKYVCLFTLVIQTSTLVLTLRYSRKSSGSGPIYLSSTAVVVSEVLKILACFVFLLKEADMDLKKLSKNLKEELTLRWIDSFKLAVPAILYTIQNNLLFLALSSLDAATYQVTYQLKILTTAMFSVAMLGKKLNRIKWFSLVLLMFGVALVQIPSGKQTPAAKERKTSSQIIGLVAVLVACLSSGFAGVYFEKLLKGSKVSLWMRNLWLAFYGIIFGVLCVFTNDFHAVREAGFFQGYTKVTWFVIILQAFGGLLVAAVVKYADNILKGFATSVSIVFSSIISYYFIGDFTPSFFFVLGAGGVLSATYLYSLPENLFGQSKI